MAVTRDPTISQTDAPELPALPRRAGIRRPAPLVLCLLRPPPERGRARGGRRRCQGGGAATARRGRHDRRSILAGNPGPRRERGGRRLRPGGGRGLSAV